MYSLFSRVDGLIPLKATFAVYIKHKGSDIVSENRLHLTNGTD